MASSAVFSPFLTLTGKVALVTGAARGLGRAIALGLARRGADVIINYNNSSDAAQTLVKDLQSLGRRVVAIQADTGSVQAILRLFSEALSHFDHLDIVVSNAGINSFSHLKDTLENFGKGGRIILFSSRTAQGRGFRAHAIYAASKGAVETMVRCMSVDCGDKKITINAIAPGPIMTDQMKNYPHYIPDGDMITEDEAMQIIGSWHPLNRVGEPQDIGRVVAFLASEDAEWINGQVIPVDGGMMR
ncbi:hypothetical protein NM208_g4565 [Fusarium decemcellulare]|uniref:Uncharacterized protein n=2 Tax=Fusarium decemcellulare TaxID=57161 RepID=A0ACC1S933_9HYPO|nr:hypothetical protein NM208_g7492 [Fusarium decemcellulare]KAJ3541537.1 hypothetical protein NM208_g4565 [Fusarium decemcellulare]